jgi:cell division septation protein DedD
VIEEKIENQPQGNEENKPKSEPSLIEIDGSIESTTVATDKQKTLSPQEKKNRLKEMKAKKEAEYKAKQKEEKQRLKDLKKLEKGTKETSSKKGKGVFIIIAIFIVLVGGFAFLFFKKPNLLKKLIPGKHKEQVTLVNSDSIVSPEKQATPTDTVSMAAEELQAEATDSKANTKNVASSQPAPEPVAAPEPKAKAIAKHKTEAAAKPAKEEKSSTAVSGKTKLNGPCWIVSFSSVKEEKVASKDVKKLVDKGFLSGYYWMPDVDPSAKQLFKVYSGPFTSETDARTKQREIAAFNPDAYVMKLNK